MIYLATVFVACVIAAVVAEILVPTAPKQPSLFDTLK